MFLPSLVIIPGGSDGSEPVEQTVKVTATVSPIAEIDAPPDVGVWELKPSGPGTYTKNGIVKLITTTRWKLSVKDANSTTNGHMTEWTGTNYANRKLQAPLKVSSNQEVTLPEGGQIQTGVIAGEQKIEVTLTQVISQDDLPLDDGSAYRIVLDFEGTPID